METFGISYSEKRCFPSICCYVRFLDETVFPACFCYIRGPGMSCFLHKAICIKMGLRISNHKKVWLPSRLRCFFDSAVSCLYSPTCHETCKLFTYQREAKNIRDWEFRVSSKEFDPSYLHKKRQEKWITIPTTFSSVFTSSFLPLFHFQRSNKRWHYLQHRWISEFLLILIHHIVRAITAPRPLTMKVSIH